MFDTMISKTLIQWIWIGWSALISLAGLIALVQSSNGFEALFVVIGTALGLGLVRVLCEGMIVIFMINENLAGSRLALDKLVMGQSTSSGRATPAGPAVPRAQSYAPPPSRQARPAVPSPATTAPDQAPSATAEPLKKDDYHDRMMAVRDQLQREAQERRKY